MKRLLLIPVACAAGFVAIYQLPAEADRWYTLALQFLGAAGPFLASRSFERGDYLRRAWLCFAFASAFLMVNAVRRLLGTHDSTESWPGLVMVILSNSATSIGAILFARTSTVAGLELPGSRLSRVAGRLASAGLALALGGPSIVSGVTHLTHGEVRRGLFGIFAAGGDIISFALIAPILLTALALRGGLIAWPWILLTGSELCWLVFDVLPRGDSVAFDVFTSCFRMAAFGFVFAAGLAQRRVSRAADG